MKYDDEKKDNRTPSRVAGMVGPDETQAKRIPFRAGAWKNFCYLM
jgi:hypothetical protein